MGTRRLRDPRYGMAVTDATGTFMLISRRTPVGARGDEKLVWWAWRLDEPSNPRQSRDYLLLLDPDQFGEVF
jgi:hypothetical protein